MRWTLGPFTLYLVTYHAQPPLLAVYRRGRLWLMLEPAQTPKNVTGCGHLRR